MRTFVAFPKWKYAAGDGDGPPRSALVNSAEEEAALGEGWFDNPNLADEPDRANQEAAMSAVPGGYTPKDYPKWLYAKDGSSRLVANEAEHDDLLTENKKVKWLDTPSADFEDPPMKDRGLPENTGNDADNILKETDPAKNSTEDDLKGAAEAEAAKAPQSKVKGVAKHPTLNDMGDPKPAADEDLL